jgi:sortase A
MTIIMHKPLYKIILALCIAVGLMALAKGGYIQLKAELAQILMQRAWQQATYTHQLQRPWSWADTHVTGIIRFNTEVHYILDTQSARNLAFGPTLLAAGDALGGTSNIIIAAHNDTHFSELGSLKIGDIVEVESLEGVAKYLVTEYAIVDEGQTGILAPTNLPALTLITCYPFSANTFNSSQRYVVRAIRI